MVEHPTPADARRLLEGTTPGPWEWSHHRIWSGVNEVLSGDTFDGGSGRMNISQGDAALIAAAPVLAAALADHEDCVPRADFETTLGAEITGIQTAEVAALRAQLDEALGHIRELLAGYDAFARSNANAFLSAVALNKEETADGN